MHAGILETALQTKDSICTFRSKTRLTGRKDSHVALSEIHLCNIICCYDAVILNRLPKSVRTRQSENAIIHSLIKCYLARSSVFTMRRHMKDCRTVILQLVEIQFSSFCLLIRNHLVSTFHALGDSVHLCFGMLQSTESKSAFCIRHISCVVVNVTDNAHRLTL